MSKVEEVVPKLQFLLTENQLEDIYESLIYAVGPATLRTQILLSKPEEEFTTKEEVYEDCFILLLYRRDVDSLIENISSSRGSSVKGVLASVVRNSLERGLMPRESD